MCNYQALTFSGHHVFLQLAAPTDMVNTLMVLSNLLVDVACQKYVK